MAKNKIDLAAQPQAVEAEKAVLGSMLISKDAVSKSLQWLPKANYFYDNKHVKIYSCMIDVIIGFKQELSLTVHSAEVLRSYFAMTPNGRDHQVKFLSTQSSKGWCQVLSIYDIA